MKKATEKPEDDIAIVRTALFTCPRLFVESYVPWVHSLPDDRYWDALVHVDCLWNHILGRQCALETAARSGWHTDEVVSVQAEPRLPDGWQDPGTLRLNADERIMEMSRSKEHRHSRIVADLVLERRAVSSPVKTESVDQQKTTLEAKGLGSFYTPAPIVDYIVQATLGRKLHPDISDQEARTVTICDPSCGDGNFLIGAAEYIFAWWWLRLGREVSAVERARIVRCQLYGVDLDPDAVAGCRKNLAKIAGCDADDIFNVRHGNSLVGIKQTTPEQYATLGPHPNQDAYDNALLGQFKDLKIKKDPQKWDAEKKKTVSAGKVDMTLDDIRELHPFHWEYEFPSIFTPGHGRPKDARPGKKAKPPAAVDAPAESTPAASSVSVGSKDTTPAAEQPPALF